MKINMAKRFLAFALSFMMVFSLISWDELALYTTAKEVNDIIFTKTETISDGDISGNDVSGNDVSEGEKKLRDDYDSYYRYIDAFLLDSDEQYTQFKEGKLDYTQIKTDKTDSAWAISTVLDDFTSMRSDNDSYIILHMQHGSYEENDIEIPEWVKGIAICCSPSVCMYQGDNGKEYMICHTKQGPTFGYDKEFFYPYEDYGIDTDTKYTYDEIMEQYGSIEPELNVPNLQISNIGFGSPNTEFYYNGMTQLINQLIFNVDEDSYNNIIINNLWGAPAVSVSDESNVTVTIRGYVDAKSISAPNVIFDTNPGDEMTTVIIKNPGETNFHNISFADDDTEVLLQVGQKYANNSYSEMKENGFLKITGKIDNFYKNSNNRILVSFANTIFDSNSSRKEPVGGEQLVSLEGDFTKENAEKLYYYSQNLNEMVGTGIDENGCLIGATEIFSIVGMLFENKEEYTSYIEGNNRNISFNEQNIVNANSLGEAFKDLSDKAGEKEQYVLIRILEDIAEQSVDVPQNLAGIILEGAENDSTINDYIRNVELGEVEFLNSTTELYIQGEHLLFNNKGSDLNIKLEKASRNRIILNNVIIQNGVYTDNDNHACIVIKNRVRLGNIRGINIEFDGNINNSWSYWAYLNLLDGSWSNFKQITFANKHSKGIIYVEGQGEYEEWADAEKLLKINGEIEPFSADADNSVNIWYANLIFNKENQIEQAASGQQVVILNEQFAEKNADRLYYSYQGNGNFIGRAIDANGKVGREYDTYTYVGYVFSEEQYKYYSENRGYNEPYFDENPATPLAVVFADDLDTLTTKMSRYRIGEDRIYASIYLMENVEETTSRTLTISSDFEEVFIDSRYICVKEKFDGVTYNKWIMSYVDEKESYNTRYFAEKEGIFREILTGNGDEKLSEAIYTQEELEKEAKNYTDGYFGEEIAPAQWQINSVYLGNNVKLRVNTALYADSEFATSTSEKIYVHALEKGNNPQVIVNANCAIYGYLYCDFSTDRAGVDVTFLDGIHNIYGIKCSILTFECKTDSQPMLFMSGEYLEAEKVISTDDGTSIYISDMTQPFYFGEYNEDTFNQFTGNITIYTRLALPVKDNKAQVINFSENSDKTQYVEGKIKVGYYSDKYHEVNVDRNGYIGVFSENKCIVSFDSQGGTGVDYIITDKGMAIRKPVAPTKEGYNFAGWYLDGEQYDFKNAVTEDIILTAHWTEYEQLEAPIANLRNHMQVVSGTKITLSNKEKDVTIYYTVDGTEPTKDSSLYENPIMIDKETTIKAFAVKEGFKDSEVVSYHYTVSGDEDWGEIIPEDIPENGIPEGMWIAGITEMTYTGKAIIPNVRVYDGKKLLTEKVDYTISCRNNVNAADKDSAKAPYIQVTGKGNYEGKATATFTILPLNLNSKDKNIVADDLSAGYNKKIQTPVPVVMINGKKLTVKKDFIVSYPDKTEGAYKEPGIYNITLTGCGNYTGIYTVKLTITETISINKAAVSAIKGQKYTGYALEPYFTVKCGKETLKAYKDYVVTYSNNVEIGKATILIEGIGKYSGSKKVEFKIEGTAITKAKVTGLQNTVYNGKLQTATPVLTVKNGKEEVILTEGVDYTVIYQNNKNTGTATVIFTGINGYYGTMKKTFKITPFDLRTDTAEQFKVESGISTAFVKTGATPKPVITFNGTVLTEGKDYTLKYANNKKVASAGDLKAPTVTITGKGNFKGTRTVTFDIVSQDLSNLSLEAADKVFKNKAKNYTTKFNVLDSNGKKLALKKDYEIVKYAYADGSEVKDTDIIPAGTEIFVTVKAKEGSGFTGELTGSYRIVQADIGKVAAKVTDQTYTGSAITPGKEEITLTMKKVPLTADDYEIVSYNNNVKKGTATVIIKGIGNYGGTKKITFKIKSKKVGFLWW